MPNMTLRQVRIVDPILSTFALGYSNPEFVGTQLLPFVDVDLSGGQVIEFGKEAFLTYNLRRAPGAATKRISFGYSGKPYALLQDSLEITLPIENIRDASTIGIDLQNSSVGKGMNIILKALEFDISALVTNASNYNSSNKVALSGGTKWSASTGDPVSDIQAGRYAIRQKTGAVPNFLTLSPAAYKAARNNPNVIDRLKATNSKGIVTTDHLATLFEVDKVVVGNAITMTDAGVASDIWGNNAILAYVKSNLASPDEPTFGSTYRMRGHPLADQPYAERNAKSMIFPVTMERAPVIACQDAGYLIQNPA